MTVPDVVVNLPSSGWTTVAAIAGCVGALGSAAGAVAAWRAASKSNTAALRAQAALGAAMRPDVAFMTQWSDDVDGGQAEAPTTVHGLVINNGSWDAADLHVRWRLTDGAVVEDSRSALDRTDHSYGGTRWLVDLGCESPAADLPPFGPGNNMIRSASASTTVDRAELTLWDKQHLQHWLVTAVRPRSDLHRAWGSTYTAID